MLSIEEIKNTLEILKKIKDEDFKEFINYYYNKLNNLAIAVDAYNAKEIVDLDKTKQWFNRDLNWQHQRRDTFYETTLTKDIQTKIFQFARHGNTLQNSLEIGPGYGRFSKMFLSWRLNYFLDVLPECESKIKKLFNPKHHQYLKFYTTDKTKCENIPTNSCNFVFSWDTFVYFTKEHVQQYLKDIFRVVLPGGYCFIHYADCFCDKDLYEAKRGYWNYNNKSTMENIIKETGYKIIEMGQFKPGANYCIFQKPGNLNPVLYKTITPPSEFLRDGNAKRYGNNKK
jgi:ubiquinone/menaquinone biosynthesis C-methylase UbiE